MQEVFLFHYTSMAQSDCDSLKSHTEKNINDSSLYVNVFITSLAELPGLALAAYILARVGRKISMEIMLVSGFLLLLPLVVHQSEVITTGSLFGARMFISASFIVVCIDALEVYPTNLRTRGVGIATAIGRTGGMVCPLIAVGMGNGCHQLVPVYKNAPDSYTHVNLVRVQRRRPAIAAPTAAVLQCPWCWFFGL